MYYIIQYNIYNIIVHYCIIYNIREVRMIMILRMNLENNSFQRVIITPMNLKLKLNSINI